MANGNGGYGRVLFFGIQERKCETSDWLEAEGPPSVALFYG